MSINQTSSIVPLTEDPLVIGSSPSYCAQPEHQPWAPFQTLEDFEVTELAVTSLLSKKAINQLLTGVTGKWSSGKSPVTLKKNSDMDAALSMARKYVVQVCSIFESLDLDT